MTDKAYWNHRTIVHRNSKDPDHEEYMTVHEIYYGVSDSKGPLWAAKPASPRSRVDAERILKAYDNPPILWVDDASFSYSDVGEGYATWGWLEQPKEQS